MLYFLPVIVIIAAVATYNISAKGIPGKINLFAGLFVTYSTMAIFAIIVFSASSGGETMIDIAKGVNWSVFTYGLAAVGIETGYILLYRAGWNISLGGVVCNILTVVSMITVGLLIFRESLDLKQIIGICFCVIGLIFINKDEFMKEKKSL